MSTLEDDEEMRPCVYCAAPWLLRSIPIDHAPSCPMLTGLYPVRPEDRDMCCCACNDPFSRGEFYVLERVRTPDEDDSVTTWNVLCLSCGSQT